jgi:hypothetical protein
LVEYAEQLVLEVVDAPSLLPASVKVPPSPLAHSVAHELWMHAKIAPSVDDSLTTEGTRHEDALPVEHWSSSSRGFVNVKAPSSRHDFDAQQASTWVWQLCAMQIPHDVVSSPAK